MNSIAFAVSIIRFAFGRDTEAGAARACQKEMPEATRAVKINVQEPWNLSGAGRTLLDQPREFRDGRAVRQKLDIIRA